MNDISNYDQWDEEGDIKYTSGGKINRAIIDGQGHTIYGLTSRLFETNLNTIKNLNIKNYYNHYTINSFSTSKVNATAYSAFVQNNGDKETNAKIINCEISGNIYYEFSIKESPNAITSIFDPNEQDYQTGGFCSICYGEIKNCRNKVNIYISRLLKKSNNTVVGYTQSIGGICGVLYNGQITNCINYGNINTTGYTGGICGKIINGKVRNCANYGDILDGIQTGGIIGCGTGDSENDNSYIEISNTYNMGTMELSRKVQSENTQNLG